MRITIRVKPGSARPGVGGEHDGALIVRVSARAVDGKATEAALAAVADSFGVRRSTVSLVSGAVSRTKIVDIDGGDPRLLASLLATPGRLRPATYARHEMPQPSGRAHKTTPDSIIARAPWVAHVDYDRGCTVVGWAVILKRAIRDGRDRRAKPVRRCE